MEQGQLKFKTFILERVGEGHEEEATALLEGNFAKQREGNFTPADALAFATEIFPLLKPEHLAEVKAILTQFSQGR